MKKRFFRPYVGRDYYRGFDNGKKVLVLGASHYCAYNEDSTKFNCPVWHECTSLERKDSSPFNEACPYYREMNGNTKKLEDCTINELNHFLDGDEYTSYRNFTNLMMVKFNIGNEQSVWDRLAFANYVQYFVPYVTTPNQTRSDMVNFEAFMETVDELNPDIVIVWGTKIPEHFSRGYIQKLVPVLEKQKNGYFWKLELNKHKIIIVNPYHPSDWGRAWSGNAGRFVDAFKYALNTPYDGEY